MIEIIPAVLATDDEKYFRDISKLSSCESLKAGWLHIDFADNKFVQNQTITPEIVKKIPSNFHKEAHLMVVNPKEWIDDLAEAGFERVIIHIESEGVDEAINYAKSKGLQVGLAIKNETDIQKLEPFVDKITVILIMSIIPGFQGQKFIPDALKKVEEIKSKWNKVVGLDGSVKDSNIKQIEQAQADFVIAGSFLLNGEVEENLERLWEALYG